LCVIGGGGFKVYLKDSGCVHPVRAVLGDVDAAAGAQGNEDLVLVTGVLV